MEVTRYHRQQILPQIGEAGQAKLSRSRVLLIGCGALGGVIAEQLVRAGIGYLRIVDRDLVEMTNLQRQVLFDESDARDGVPKAIAAVERLRAINSRIEIEPRVADVGGDNIEALAHEMDVILDGTDNVETRYVINDASIKLGVPWVYGACVGVEGRAMPILPNRSACLRCIFPEPPAPGELPTCDTAGVLASSAAMVASLQVVIAMRVLLDCIEPKLILIDAWAGELRSVDASNRNEGCPACALRRFEFLDRSASSEPARLCGRNAVQVRPSRPASVSLDAIARKLSSAGEIHRSPHLVRCRLRDGGVELSVFPDGRAIVSGTNDIARARSIYARWIGA